MSVINYDLVQVGEAFPPFHLSISEQEVASYLSAVGTPDSTKHVPPLMLLALAMSEMTSAMPLPPSALHVGQELSQRGPVRAGSHIEVRWQLVSRKVMRGSVLSVWGLAATSIGRLVLDGRTIVQTLADP